MHAAPRRVSSVGERSDDYFGARLGESIAAEVLGTQQDVGAFPGRRSRRPPPVQPLEKGHTQTMSHGHSSAPALFTQVDVTASAAPVPAAGHTAFEHTEILREVLAAQDRTNEILEELLNTMAASHKQRLQELHQWKNANPRLAESCREAAEALSRVQVEYLEQMTAEINDTAEDMVCGEYMFNEFVDRCGPRLAHLNSVIQVLAQLGSQAAAQQNAQ